VRLNLVCKRDPVRDVAIRGGQSRVAPEWSPNAPVQGLPAANSTTVLSSEERHAYRYYASVLVYHLTVSERFNSFLSGTNAQPNMEDYLN
jgi:hypothetical protein